MSSSNSGAVLRIEQLEEELRVAGIQVDSVQRNYDGLSVFMQEKEREVQTLKTLVNAERSRNADFGVKLEDAHNQAESLRGKVKDLEKWRKKYEHLKEENDRSQFNASLAGSVRASLQEKIDNLVRRLKQSEEEKQAVVKELEYARRRSETHLANVREKEDAVRGTLREQNALKSQLHAEVDTVRRLRKELAENDAKLSNARKAFGMKDDEFCKAQDTVRSLENALDEAASSNQALKLLLATEQEQKVALESHLSSLQRTVDLQVEEKQSLERTSNGLAIQVKQLEQDKSRIHQDNESLRKHLEAFDDRARRTSVEKDAAEEAVEEMTEKLSEMRERLAECRREKKRCEEDLKNEIGDLRERLAASEAALSKSSELFADQLTILDHWVDTSSTKCEETFSSITKAVTNMEEKCSLAQREFDRQLGYYLASIASLERQAEDTSRASMERLQACSNDSTARAKRLECGYISSVKRLEQDLQLERRRSAKALEELSRARGEFAIQMKGVRDECGQQLQEQNSRLTDKLQEAETELSILKKRWQDEKAASNELMEMERNKAKRDVDELRTRMSNLQRDIHEHQRTGKIQLNDLRKSHAAEMASLKADHEATIRQKDAAASTFHENVEQSFLLVLAIWEDMKLVVQHLKKMGVVDQAQLLGTFGDDAESPGNLNGCDKENVSAEGLLQVAQFVRLRFSYLTEQFQNMVASVTTKCFNNLPKVPEFPAHLKEEAQQLKSTVQKLVHAEDSLSTNYTCLICLNVFQTPVSCVPCGHTYCEKCMQEHEMRCVECGERRVLDIVPNQALDRLCSKYEYKKSALNSIARLCSNLPS